MHDGIFQWIIYSCLLLSFYTHADFMSLLQVVLELAVVALSALVRPASGRVDSVASHRPARVQILTCHTSERIPMESVKNGGDICVC